MKIALVHELLTMRGGAERVLRILADMYPEAPIYTLLYNEKKLGEWFPKERVRPAKIPSPYLLIPSPYRFNHHLYLKHFPKMIESLDFSEFDLVISTSSAFAHGIITNGKPMHLSYINAPARYLWDRTHDVTEKASKGILGPLKKAHLERTFHKLRTWDSEASSRADKLIAASEDVQRRIELYWRKKSDVIYPPMDNFWLENSFGGAQRETQNYFLIVSTLVSYKNIDLAIEACNALKLPLKIVGEGPYKKKLQQMAGPTIEFYGYRQRDELGDLYADAKALIFPGIEDFGIAPLEAMACGTPVISYRAGGPLETIVEGKTGEFFDEQTTQSLIDTLEKFDAKNFDADVCKNRAKEFSQERFEQNIKDAVSQMQYNVTQNN